MKSINIDNNFQSKSIITNNSNSNKKLSNLTTSNESNSQKITTRSKTISNNIINAQIKSEPKIDPPLNLHQSK